MIEHNNIMLIFQSNITITEYNTQWPLYLMGDNSVSYKIPYHLSSNLMEINVNHINCYLWLTAFSLCFLL